MNINDLIGPEDWDSLGYDPDERYVRLLDIAFPRMEALLTPIRSGSGVNSQDFRRARYDLHLALVNAAQAEEVEAFTDFDVPDFDEYEATQAAQIDDRLNAWHARTKTLLRKRDIETRIRVTKPVAETMISDFERIRDTIKSSALKPSKQADLLKRLQAIEDDLRGGGTINVMKFIWLTTQILMVPGGIVQSYELLDGPVMGLMKSFVEAKAEDDLRRAEVFELPSRPKPLAITHQPD